MNLIDKINAFESGEQTVARFNEMFPHSRLHLDNALIVEIGNPCSPETTRELFIGTEVLKYDFRPTLMADAYEADPLRQTGEWTARKASGQTFWRNAAGEFSKGTGQKKGIFVYNEDNFVLSKKEMELSPTQYFILQYLRGCESAVQTKTEIATRLSLSIRTVRDVLMDMQMAKIIKMEYVQGNKTKSKITVTEDWLDN